MICPRWDALDVIELALALALALAPGMCGILVGFVTIVGFVWREMIVVAVSGEGYSVATTVSRTVA